MESKWKHTSQTDECLKKIAKDIYNSLIYTDRHFSKNDNIISHFMPLLFMGPKTPEAPKYPSENSNLEGQRDNKLYDLVQREKDQKEYEKALENFPFEKECYDKYIADIGLVYEYMSGSMSPMAINGKPVFMSCRFLDKDDTKKMFDYYNQYSEIREKADKF